MAHHYVLKQSGRVLNVVPNALSMNQDVDERACCVVVQECCCIAALVVFSNLCPPSSEKKPTQSVDKSQTQSYHASHRRQALNRHFELPQSDVFFAGDDKRGPRWSTAPAAAPGTMRSSASARAQIQADSDAIYEQRELASLAQNTPPAQHTRRVGNIPTATFTRSDSNSDIGPVYSGPV